MGMCGVVTFYRVDRKGFYEKAMFEQRLKRNEGVSLGLSM